MSDHDQHDEDHDEDGRPFCSRRTKGGRGPRCKRRAMPGHDRCPSHAYKVPGRPSKLKPAIADAIIAEVLDGAYMEIAAQAAGVNKTTLYRWLRRADDAEAKALEHVDDDDPTAGAVYDHADPADWPYLDFRHALKSAEAYSELELTRDLRALARAGGKWQAFGFMLERRHPARWRRRDSSTVDLTGDVRRSVEIIAPADDDRAKVLAALKASGALDVEAANSDEAPDGPSE